MALGNRNDLDGVDMQDTVHESVIHAVRIVPPFVIYVTTRIVYVEIHLWDPSTTQQFRRGKCLIRMYVLERDRV